MTITRPIRTTTGLAGLAAVAVLAACTGTQDAPPPEDGGDGPTADATTEEPLILAADVADALAELSPGGATPGEDPYSTGAVDSLAACYGSVATSDDGEIVFQFYGTIQEDAVWVSVLVAEDTETAAAVAEDAVAMTADCEGSSQDLPAGSTESVASGTEQVAGTEAGWSVHAVEVPSGQIHDGDVVLGTGNIVVQVTTGHPDLEVARENALAFADEVVGAITP